MDRRKPYGQTATRTYSNTDTSPTTTHMVHHQLFKSSNDQKEVDVGPDGHVAEEEAPSPIRKMDRSAEGGSTHAWPATIG